jgi:hypothetical protein
MQCHWWLMKQKFIKSVENHMKVRVIFTMQISSILWATYDASSKLMLLVGYAAETDVKHGGS